MQPHRPLGGLAAACLLAAPAVAQAPASAVEAERAFAAMAQSDGVGAAFRAFAAPDAIAFSPEPQPAAPGLAQGPARPPIQLTWRPTAAGQSRAGDLAFNTGPYVLRGARGERRGWFFTLWRRQPDGSWRWYLDKGTSAPAGGAAGVPGPDAPVAMAVAGRGAPVSAEAAQAAVAALEARLQAGAVIDTAAAYRRVLARDVRLAADGRAPATGLAGAAVELAARPARMTMRPLGGGASSDGDLVFTYGEARWRAEGAERRAHYVRVWRHAGATWELIFDELADAPLAAA